MLAQDGIDFFAEPGVVAELERDAGRAGLQCGDGEKCGEQVGVGLEVWRELKEQEAELAGLRGQVQARR